MAHYNEVREILKANVELAKSELEQAEAALWSIAGDSRQHCHIPANRLTWDDSEEIGDAYHAEIEARERYVAALRRFNYFLIYEASVASVSD